MAKKKARKKAAPKPELAWFVVLYEIRDFDDIFMPGHVFSRPVGDIGPWEKYLDSRYILPVEDEDVGLAVATEIHDGEFVLAPQVEHSMAHGGFGKPKRK